MRNMLTLVVVVCSIIMGTSPSKAQQLLESYKAFLSERDHFNSSGQRLTTAAAIIRQDRANYHRYGLRDQGDESDSFFADADNRAALERLLERGRAEPGVISRIVNGTPFVRVEVWQENTGPFVVVTLIEPSKIRSEESQVTDVAQPYTPPVGSQERVAIMDAARAAGGQPISYKVNSLTVLRNDNKAIAIADLEDSANQYPVGIVFFENMNGRWRALYLVGTDGSENCKDVSAVYEKILAIANSVGALPSFFPNKFLQGYAGTKMSTDDCEGYMIYDK